MINVLNYQIIVFIIYGKNFVQCIECVIFSHLFETQATTFAITNTKLYVSVVTLLNQGNTKLLEQLKPSFKRTLN